MSRRPTARTAGLRSTEPGHRSRGNGRYGTGPSTKPRPTIDRGVPCQGQEVSPMRALVVYESMYGNTRDVAKAVADGLATRMPVQLTEVGTAPTVLGDDIGLLVVGAPDPWPRHEQARNPASRPNTVSPTANRPSSRLASACANGWPVSRMRRRRPTWQPRRSIRGSRAPPAVGFGRARGGTASARRRGQGRRAGRKLPHRRSPRPEIRSARRGRAGTGPSLG